MSDLICDVIIVYLTLNEISQVVIFLIFGTNYGEKYVLYVQLYMIG
jgi:hypothetical protein